MSRGKKFSVFGFLRLKSCGLEPEEKGLYRADFCSVCHSMRQFGGLSASLLTNYDITVWFSVAAALDSPKTEQTQPRPCTALPFRKVGVTPVSVRLGQTMAALNLALVEAKLEDSLADGETRMAGLGLKALGARREKAHAFLKQIDFPLEDLVELNARQQQLESRQQVTLWELAEPTRKLTSSSFGFIAKLSNRPELTSTLAQFGGHLGSFVYLWDALEDVEQDFKSERFNALLRALGRDWSPSVVRAVLEHHLKAMEKASEALPLGLRSGLITQLIASLRHKIQRHPRLLPSRKVDPMLGRQALAQAGYVAVQDCDDCCCPCDVCDCGDAGGCCDCNCCGGGGGGDCCDVSCCGGGERDCCHFDCCNGFTGCCDCDDCCCCCCGGDDLRSYNRRTYYDHDTSCCFFNSGPEPDYRARATSQPPQPAPKKKSWTQNLAKNFGLGPRIKGDGATCPGCGNRMKLLDIAGIEIDECRHCGGVWLDDSELDQFSGLETIPERLLRVEAAADFIRALPEGQRMCPRCRTSLDLLDFESLRIDVCRSCRGTYLDNGELAQMLTKATGQSPPPSPQKCRYCQSSNEAAESHCQSCGAPL